MKNLLELVNVTKSPLSRIMTVFNSTDPVRRTFENNICATHIGDGFVISVAHNLFSEVQIYRSLPEEFYQNQILHKLSQPDVAVLNSKYSLDTTSQKRHASFDQNDIPTLSTIFRKTGLDMRYCRLYHDNIASPYLIFNFDVNSFFDGSNNIYFDLTNSLHEQDLGKYTFIIELELLDYDFKKDFSIYRFKDKYMPLAPSVPSIDVDYTIYDNSYSELFCLQGAPADNLGRMINKATIEGYIDQFSPVGNYNGETIYFEGLRYLIKGYFRFGSSGAPYVYFDDNRERFVVNAIQSEACPQQLLIGNNRDGHAQYVNAIATPLINAKDFIEKYTN